jgi:UDP-glucose 4-epimerase
LAQHVLVTGAAGFIGDAIARDALERGDIVSVIGHGLDRPATWDATESVQRIAGFVGLATLDRLPAPPDVVFHCAGGANVQASIAQPEQDRERTVGSTDALAQWLVANAPGARLVYPSSGAVYGEAAGRPDGRSGTCTPMSPYGQHKADAEAVLLRAAERSGLAVAIVRLFSVYGPGLRKQLLWDACGKMAAGTATFFGTGVERRDFVEISDVVALMRAAAGAVQPMAAPVVVDGGTGHGIAVRDVLALLADGFDPPPVVQFLGTARAGDPTDMIASRTAADTLGWSPQVPLAQGLLRYVQWFRAGAE